MSKLRSGFLHALAWYVVVPLCLLGFRVAAKGRGLDRLRVGKLSLWGDRPFLDLCKSSIERLKALDLNLYEALTRHRWVWVWQSPKSEPDSSTSPRLFSIDPAYVAWQTDGIIARLVYVAFYVSACSRRKVSQDGVRSTNRSAMEESLSWLKTRGFPDELAACYSMRDNTT